MLLSGRNSTAKSSKREKDESSALSNQPWVYFPEAFLASGAMPFDNSAGWIGLAVALIALPAMEIVKVLALSFLLMIDVMLHAVRSEVRDVFLSEPHGGSRGLCIRSAPAASALPLTKPQI